MGSKQPYLVTLTDMLNMSQTVPVDLKRWALLAHLHKDLAGSKIPSWVILGELNCLLCILECGRQVVKLLIAGSTVIV